MEKQLFVYALQHSMSSNRAVFTVQPIAVKELPGSYVGNNGEELVPGFVQIPKTKFPLAVKEVFGQAETQNSVFYYVLNERNDDAAQAHFQAMLSSNLHRLEEDYLAAKEALDSAKIVFPPMLKAAQKTPHNMSPTASGEGKTDIE